MAVQNPETIIWKPAGDARPPDGVIDSGWLPGEKPPAEYENFMMNYVTKALEFFINNGIPNHSTVTSYKESAVVKHNGLIYIALQDNQNTPPTEGGDSIWAEIPTSISSIPWDRISGKPSTYPVANATSTSVGGVKMRVSGTTLYLTNNGTDA
jgi:hypothetical protein